MATAKQLINAPEDVVDELLDGLLLSTPQFTQLEGLHVVLRHDYATAKLSQVSVVSGGGSGHEPAMAGYVGTGGLMGAVAGGIFASPNVFEIISCIRAATGSHGCLVIVMNYTGDRLNFGLAVEQAKAEGLDVELVIVSDDCALLERDEDRIVGPRGVAGTVLVHKAAGAAAAAGASLAEVAAVAQAMADAVGTVGVALEVCTLPGEAPNDRLAAGEIELGLGIHGEPGTEVLAAQPADGVIDRMIGMIQTWPGAAGSPAIQISNGDGVVLLVNNLGATPPAELYVCARRAIRGLVDSGVAVERVYVGAFMTSLNMAGLSVSLLKLPPGGSADREAVLSRLDAPTSAPAWPNAAAGPRRPAAAVPVPPGPAKDAGGAALGPSVSTAAAERLRAAVAAAAAAVVAAEPQLTEWDRICGDGDAGITFRRGAERVLADAPGYTTAAPATALDELADSIREAQGGTSGVILDIFFRALSGALRSAGTLDPEIWPKALAAGAAAVSKYGGASAGMRTVLDAMMPAADAGRDLADSAAAGGHPVGPAPMLAKMAAAALAGAEATKTMNAAAGRASYIRAELVRTVPDPGAMAVAIALKGLKNSMAAASL